jgi:hypothetical protein
MRGIEKLVEALLSADAHRATRYVSPTEVVRATRLKFKGGFNKRNLEVYVQVGKPNYRERQFIKLAKKAGVAFPIRKIQFQG